MLLLLLLQDKVLEVQPEQLLNDGGSATGGSIRLASGSTIHYDWLVVSLGAAADPRGVPGVRENARPFVSLEDAEFVAQQLAAYEARAALGQAPATVAIVGAGYAGVELAAVVGERLKGKARVVLLTPGAEILEAAPAGQREAAVQVRCCGVL
jgi:NADH dehydrogenase FAD-containing subunit